MEQLDIFDKHGTRTGEILVRGQDELQPGHRILVVHIWVINSKGELLIQRRADHLKAWPGRWTTTGGAVSSGEDSHLSACRELAEELGVRVAPADMHYLDRIVRDQLFIHVYLTRTDVPIEAVVLQPEEVSDARWVTLSEMQQMMADGQFHNYGKDYQKRIFPHFGLAG